MSSDKVVEKLDCGSQDGDTDQLIAIAKNHRGKAKSAITKFITGVDKLIRSGDVSEIKSRLKDLPHLKDNLEKAHSELYELLEVGEDRHEADVYKAEVFQNADEFLHATLNWLAEIEQSEETRGAEKMSPADDLGDRSAQPPDMTMYLPVGRESKPGSHELQSQNEEIEREISELKRQQELEYQKHELLIERQRQEAEFARVKFQLEKERQMSLLSIEKEQREMEAEIEKLKKGTNPTPAKNTQSTPQLRERQRLSWEPSRIEQRDESSLLADVLQQVMNQSQEQQRSLVHSLQLPRSELKMFDGNPISYWPFIRAFYHTVDSRDIDPGMKLTCLLQYCTGRASRLLQCCLVKEPEEGYRMALRLLEDRFGNKYVIAQEWIKKIKDHSGVKGKDDLRDFADDLQCCHETLKSMGYSSELDNSHSMLAIVEKLPYHLQTRWLRENHSIKINNGRNSTLGDLVKFVSLAADEASDPVFGKVIYKDKESRTKKQAGSFAAQMSSEKDSKAAPTGEGRSCPKCKGSHYLTQCQAFKDLRVKDRLSFVQAQNLCVNCFRPGHFGRDCPRPFTCKIDGCGLKHSSYLHLPRRPPTETSSPAISSQETQPDATLPSRSSSPVNGNPARDHVSHFSNTKMGKRALPIIPARVRCPNSNDYVDTYAMLDPGTNSSYCSQTLQEILRAKGRQQCFELTTIAQNKVPMTATVISLSITDVEDKEPQVIIPEVTVRPSLNIELVSRARRVEVDRWPHLRDIHLRELQEDHVHLMIGQDCPDLLVPLEFRKGKSGEPFAVRTLLGWTINGPLERGFMLPQVSHFVKTKPLEKDLEGLWRLEEPTAEKYVMSDEDCKVLKLWDEQRELRDGRWSLNIPFKSRQPNLPNNFAMAEHRLHHLGKRLQRNENLKMKYTEEMNKLLQNEYAEQVPEYELDRQDGKVWYLPHHPVMNPKRPNKCRIVFDCAAKFQGTSLNDNIFQGPDLANKLNGVLLRFRENPVAFMADVEAMFLQVKVPADDRDVLRFLWWRNNNINEPIVVHRMTRHLFGGVWSPACANYALRLIADSCSDEVRTTILNNFYVDDCLKSVNSVDAAIDLADGLKTSLQERGFNLTKWTSNSTELLRSIDPDDWEKSLKKIDINFDEMPTERALGMLWNMENDSLGFDVQVDKKPKTKRGVLSTLSTVYDPLGYVSPFILKARILFQELCRRQLSWDDTLPQDLVDQWGRWLQDLSSISEFSMPRCVRPSEFEIKYAELHHFSDASQTGYGAVSYLRIISEKDDIIVNLLMAKSRLAPLRGSTIPRLELAGAVEAVNLDEALQESLEIPIKRSIFWTDSTIVLWYIQNEHQRFKVYVANRVAKIRNRTQANQWRYVPSEENPGDDASRGMSAGDLLNNTRWKRGPAFLQKTEQNWPSQPAFKCTNLDSMLEIRNSPAVYSTMLSDDPISKLISYYSSWHKLKKAVAWLLRFRQALRKKSVFKGAIEVEEIRGAELEIIKWVQRGIEQKSLRKLNLARSTDGTVRVGGRLEKSDLDFDAKHPLILPGTHHISRLIVEEFHLKTGHSGVERVLAETRSRYWIMNGRKLVKRVVSKCITCRKQRRPLEQQQMADLPKSRVTSHEAPFTRVGIDYFGPFYVRRGRSDFKRYGCVFTCLQTRAVHIEVSFDLSTDSFINALQRFIARRGEPAELRSDNGTNFVGAQMELKRALQDWNENRIKEFLLKHEVTWHFNPPGASHMGGIWERQIRTIRTVMLGLLKQQILDDEGLATLFAVVEGIINNRPITKLSDDPTDDRPLTPNHLLLMRSGPVLPPGVFVEKDLYKRRWRQVQYLSDIFWRRWLSEYLPTLQKRQRWFKERRNVEPGDLVLVCQDNTPRNQWPLGLIRKTREGTDGLVRAVTVKTSSGTYERPITKICLLEGVDDK